MLRTNAADITTADKFACAERELKMRLRVYPRHVAKNKMTVSQAAHEIACMKAIKADYEAQLENRLL